MVECDDAGIRTKFSAPRPWLRAAAILLLTLAMAGPSPAAPAKPSHPQPGLFQGFSGTSDQPISVTSDVLEVHQTDQAVIFTGNVVATQGASTLRSNELTVYYEDTGGGADGGAPAGDQASGGRSVKRMEANGSVTVTSADQKAEGDTGIFDMKSSKATLTGTVVLTQKQNIVRGKKLDADLNTNVVRLTGGVRAHFVQDQPPPKAKARPAAGKRRAKRAPRSS
jgi:lipopolysaccharide export system protein LptA